MNGSLINNQLSGSNQPEPVIGMGCTKCMWSDREAYTIIDVSENRKTIVVQRDSVKRIDSNGMSESQEYEYTQDPNGEIEVVTLRKNGRWITQGEPMKNGTGWLIGERCEYYDYSF